ncbi:hypothetical protein [Rhodococcus sp. (in: high G+C Gram-positive bacteria)]|uniref:hypothetical protein n=1 Tax=Rhodococcus sp. TaxID=1831 RepID=UPI00388E388F
MVFDRDRTPSHLPFSIVRKGFDRDEVTNYFARFEAELRVTATDRDAASAQARDLARQLENARNEIDELRRDVDRLSVPPTTAEGMSDRISRMLRLASDEASELRARAEADSAEMISLAEQEGIRLRGDYEQKLAELEERRLAFEDEHKRTMAAARKEADRIVAAARAEADRHAAEAESKREQVQQDFEITMAERRSKLLGELDNLERTSKAEAERRIDVATQEAARRLATATEQSERKVANARDLTEEMRMLRGRILGQLDAVREQLDDVPTMLAAINREGELLDREISLDTPRPGGGSTSAGGNTAGGSASRDRNAGGGAPAAKSKATADTEGRVASPARADQDDAAPGGTGRTTDSGNNAGTGKSVDTQKTDTTAKTDITKPADGVRGSGTQPRNTTGSGPNIQGRSPAVASKVRN